MRKTFVMRYNSNRHAGLQKLARLEILNIKSIGIALSSKLISSE